MLCDYGCGNEAGFILKNEKNCCSKHHNSCPARKEKNRAGVKRAHKEGRGWTFNDEARQKSIVSRRDTSADVIFVENSSATNETVKALLFSHFDVEHKCQNCGLEKWQGILIPLELDHINGISRDNRLNNLRLLCPNCHSITPTWRGKNKNTGKIKVSDKEVLTAFEKCSNIRQTLIEVGLSPKGGNYARVKKILAKHN